MPAVMARLLLLLSGMRVPIPKQHGAWGMLYVPYLTAVFYAGIFDLKPLLAFLILTIGFFIQELLFTLIRTYPVRQTEPDRFSFLVRWIAFYSLAGAIVLFYMMHLAWRPLIPLFGCFAIVVFLLHLQAVSKKTDRKILGEWMSVLSLTMSAPFTWYVVTGNLDRFALILWILNVLFFTSSIFYVKARVASVSKKKMNTHIRRDSVIYHCTVLTILLASSAAGILSWIAILAYAPILVRAFWGILAGNPKLNLRRIGLAEIGFSLIFLFLLTYALMEHRV